MFTIILHLKSIIFSYPLYPLQNSCLLKTYDTLPLQWLQKCIHYNPCLTAFNSIYSGSYHTFLFYCLSPFLYVFNTTKSWNHYTVKQQMDWRIICYTHTIQKHSTYTFTPFGMRIDIDSRFTALIMWLMNPERVHVPSD